MTTSLTDHIADIVLRANALGPAKSVADIAALLISDQDAVLVANYPAVREGGPTFQFGPGGSILGPVANFDIRLTNQKVANLFLKDFYRTLGLHTLVPAGQFMRWTKSRHEIKLAGEGRLRNSLNHRSGTGENGVSVAEGPWVYCLTSRYCYFVSGSIVGEGSDGEPLLDRDSIRVTGELSSRARVIEEFYLRNKGTLEDLVIEKDIPPGELFCFLLGSYHYA